MCICVTSFKTVAHAWRINYYEAHITVLPYFISFDSGNKATINCYLNARGAIATQLDKSPAKYDPVYKCVYPKSLQSHR